MADCEQAHLGEFIYNTYVQEKHIESVGPAKERIVRCKDCKYYSDHEWVIATDVSDVCHFWHGEPTKVEPMGFCKWGKRRDDA